MARVDYAAAQMPFALTGFVAQQVLLPRLNAFELASGANAEALL
jgi:hypothetical protein